ncbi:MAG: hypothetical protein WC942_04615 [Clostridia bacterium]|jgi:hypothetical protein
MAMPTIDKTWQIVETSIVTTNHYQYLLSLKNVLISLPTNPWVVTGSSDAATAGMDGVDRWTDINKLVRGTSAAVRSWIVLKQTGIHADFEICIELSGSNTYNGTILWSTAGFTGGATNARPTATSFRFLVNNAGWSNSTSTNCVSCQLIVMQSTDGECTRAFFITPNAQNLPVCNIWFIADKVKNPISGWTTPYYAGWSGGSTASKTVWDWNTLTARLTIENGDVVMSGESCISNLIISQSMGKKRNDLNNKLMINKIGLISSTAAYVGHLGEVYDMWWVTDSTLHGGGGGIATATMWPSDGSRQFWQLNNWLLPWGKLKIPNIMI